MCRRGRKWLHKPLNTARTTRACWRDTVVVGAFPSGIVTANYDVCPDGKRVLVPRFAGDDAPVLVLGWLDEVRARGRRQGTAKRRRSRSRRLDAEPLAPCGLGEPRVEADDRKGGRPLFRGDDGRRQLQGVRRAERVRAKHAAHLFAHRVRRQHLVPGVTQRVEPAQGARDDRGRESGRSRSSRASAETHST